MVAINMPGRVVKDVQLNMPGKIIEKKPEGLMTPKKRPTWESTVYDLVSDKLGVNKNMWDIYREELAKIESRGSGNYHAKGGANDHYDGRYQLGKDAKIDAAKLLGLELSHDKKSRENFRASIDLQEKAFAAYTAQNHRYMMVSPEYRKLSKEGKLAALAYAHNQGHGRAKSWLKTGKVTKDSFGTPGTKFSDALKAALK
tara:strand:- start:1499 stop:2098 length:600 start_codon:yes stop_codon:yes gene_type:complete